MRLGVICMVAGCFVKPDPPSQRGDGGGIASSIQYVKTFVQTKFDTGSTTFMTSAAQRGNAILIHIATADLEQATFTFTAPFLWHAMALGTHVNAATFAMIAPDDRNGLFSVTASPPLLTVVLGDELTGNDQTGGTTTFPTHAEIDGVDTACRATVVVHDDGDALWAGCTSTGQGMPGPGYSEGTSFQGDLTEYRLGLVAGTTDVTAPTQGRWVITAATIKPQ